MQMGNFNFLSGSTSSSSYDLHETGGELAIGQSDSASYTVKSGFEYVRTLIPFSFTLSQNYIDFGTINPQTFYTDALSINVTSGAAFGYKVTSIQNHRLENQDYSGIYMPNTVGDSATITPTVQGVWVNTNTYGLGYTLSNITGTDASFTSGYRSFSDSSLLESPITVMSNNGAVPESEVSVTYKLNVDPIQQNGEYQNIVTYTMTATF